MDYSHRSTIQAALAVLMSVSVSIVAARAAEVYGNVARAVQAHDGPQVVAPIKNPRVWRSDASVKADVRKTLRTDRSLADSTITVKSVRRGVVLLSGIAASSLDEARALRSAAGRPGVRRVLSEIETLDAVAAPFASRIGGIPIAAIPPVRHEPFDTEDDVIRRNVERALHDLDSGESADIHVLVNNGIVSLSGSVPTWQGNDSRIYATRSVTGVRSIINSLRVVALNDNRR
jgi:osmotically-inducible protein OsmY